MQWPVRAAIVGAALLCGGVARAEVDELKLGLQFGIGYLPLYVMQHGKTVEKHLAAAGLGKTRVTWSRLASGGPMNDALLAGSLHVAAGGVPPFLTLWGRTQGTYNMKGVAALCSMPLFLVTNNPNVKSLRDFTDKDRISIAGAGISVQTNILQMAAAREYGDSQFNRLATLMVNLPHPEGLAALLSGREVTAYLSSPPFQYQALERPGVRKVFSSYEVMGGPATFLMTWSTSQFRNGNPRSYKAYVSAYREAVEFINRDRRAAAEIYLKASGDKESVDNIVKQLSDPDIRITMTPENTLKFVEFMTKVGTLKARPASWKDLFFSEIHDLPGG